MIDGLLAAVAYHPRRLVSGLCVHSHGGQPAGNAADHSESLGGVATHWNLARQHLELSPVGPPDFPADCFGKAGPGPLPGAPQEGCPCVHASGDSPDLAPVCGAGCGADWNLPDPPVPLLWRWHCSKPGGLPSLWEAVWALPGSGLPPLQSLAGADLGPDPVFCSGNGGVPVAVLGGSLLHIRFRE